MATFVVLFNWTDQGIKGYKDSPKRVPQPPVVIDYQNGFQLETVDDGLKFLRQRFKFSHVGGLA